MASGVRLVAANLSSIILFTLEENGELSVVRVVAVVFSLYGVNNVCMCACLTGKMSHHSGAAAGCIHLALVCVCV